MKKKLELTITATTWFDDDAISEEKMMKLIKNVLPFNQLRASSVKVDIQTVNKANELPDDIDIEGLDKEIANESYQTSPEEGEGTLVIDLNDLEEILNRRNLI